MKVHGPGAPLGPAGSKPAGTRSRTFSLGDAGPTGEASATEESSAAASIASTVVDLVGGDDEKKRRRQAIDQGTSALKALQGLQMCILDGSLDGNVARQLMACLDDVRGVTNDPGLEDTLMEVRERLEVEIAKMQASGGK
jgi:hypothetical protein